jgi:hypothetical protein
MLISDVLCSLKKNRTCKQVIVKKMPKIILGLKKLAKNGYKRCFLNKEAEKYGINFLNTLASVVKLHN